MPPAARQGDQILKSTPHCHANIHPAAPTATPAPHPGMPLNIVQGSPTVTIGGQPAARVNDQSQPCTLAGCSPGGPGMIAQGSATVMINNMPAARAGDQSSHSSCVAPIPAPTGQVIPPCCPTVMIGG